MRLLYLSIGLGAGALVAFVATSVVLAQRYDNERKAQIVFAPKSYSDPARTAIGDGVVGMSGTLTGNGVRNKSNQYSVACIRERQECVVASVEQIGSNQIGRMEAPIFYLIKKWSDTEIVAEEEVSDFHCQKVTITITRCLKLKYLGT